jgi:HemY protein
VLRLVAQLEKREALHPVAARQLRVQAYGALFAACDEPDALRKLWSGVPAAERTQPQVAALAADAFVAARDPEAGASARGGPRCRLVRGAGRALRRAAGAGRRPLAARPRRGVARALRRRAGRAARAGGLCLAERLWGKAQAYLEQAAVREPSAATHLALARLFEATDRPEQAGRHYARARCWRPGGGARGSTPVRPAPRPRVRRSGRRRPRCRRR